VACARRATPTLPPGEYRFRVKAVTETGGGSGEATSLAITVVPRFWKRNWFLGGTTAGAIGALVAGMRYLTWRKLQSRLEIHERQRAIERERARIARDLHADLGASLTQIALLS
jgi:signal transduction histidine kinase